MINNNHKALNSIKLNETINIQSPLNQCSNINNIIIIIISITIAYF